MPLRHPNDSEQPVCYSRASRLRNSIVLRRVTAFAANGGRLCAVLVWSRLLRRTTMIPLGQRRLCGTRFIQRPIAVVSKYRSLFFRQNTRCDFPAHKSA